MMHLGDAALVRADAERAWARLAAYPGCYRLTATRWHAPQGWRHRVVVELGGKLFIDIEAQAEDMASAIDAAFDTLTERRRTA